MEIVKTTLFSLRAGGRTYELVWRKLEILQFNLYKKKHEQPSRFYRPVRWEFGVCFHRRCLSIHYKRDV